MKKIKVDKDIQREVIRIDKNLKNKHLPCKRMRRKGNTLLCDFTQLTCVILIELSQLSGYSRLGNYLFPEHLPMCPGAKPKGGKK